MSWLSRLKNALNPRQLDDELAEEIRDHLERRASDWKDRGSSDAEARRQASLAFGNATSIREQSREHRLWTTLEVTCQDMSYAWRGLIRNPVFTATAVFSLGLAIGANTAIYSIVDAVMLRPLPVSQPERLFTLETSESDQPGLPIPGGKGSIFSYPLYEQLRTAAGDSARIALFEPPNKMEAQIGVADAPREDVAGQFVSPNALDTLGVPPAFGQLFSEAEDRYPSPRAVVVLSHDYWRRRFSEDPGVIGRTLLLNERAFSILGVAQKGFSGAEPGKFIDVWLPITMAAPGIFANAEFKAFRLMGRLSPAITRAQIMARLQPTFHLHQETRIGSGLAMPPSVQKQIREMKIKAQPGANGLSAFRRTFSKPLRILWGVAACILLIACANVASLLLARSTTRSGEMALRISLGARRFRLVRQFLTESLLISALAGVFGWLFARLAAPALVAMVSSEANPVRLDLALDTRILLFCAAICAFSALLFGLLPALHATGIQPMLAIRRDYGQIGKLKLGRVFVTVQMAFAFCLVTGGAAFVFSLRNLAAVDTGFDPKNVTVLTVTNTLGPQERDRQLAFVQQLQARVSALPNVQGAATAWWALFSGARRPERVILPGKQPSERQEIFYRISPGYFETLRTPILEGRDFSLRDNDDEPVPAIVNLAFARAYFQRESVLGQEFQRDDGARHRIVGVVADSHYGELRGGPEPIVYMPMKPPRAFTLYVRSTFDSRSVVRMVEREAAAMGAGARVRDVTTLEALVGGTILKEKLLASLSGAFAVLGLILAATGLFGLLNYSVTRRTKEFGVRTALGAPAATIYHLVLRDLMTMMLAGLVVGLAGSFALMRYARSLLFGIQETDPVVVGSAIAVFALAAVIAGALPAHRAATLDPVVVLRQD